MVRAQFSIVVENYVDVAIKVTINKKNKLINVYELYGRLFEAY